MPMLAEPAAAAGFSGSYAPGDVTFLLRPVHIDPTPTVEKERLIQSGERHYSELLAMEQVPGAAYLALYHQALEVNADRMAADVARLARTLDARWPPGEIVLVSLARAGTPLGVLLRRALARLRTTAPPHYSVSIIRDRGIDAVALDHVRARHDERRIVFVDGWTGKGAISRELRRSVAGYNRRRGARVPARLAVLADLAGAAQVAATAEDYLIPSSVLNAVVSGLVSRTVLRNDLVGPGDFHACRYYAEWAEHDLSRAFVDRVFARVDAWLGEPSILPVRWNAAVRGTLRRRSAAFMLETMARYGLRDENRVKPGIGESARALLRRVPDRLLLRDACGPDVRPLLHLAGEAGVPVEIHPTLPYRATIIIRSLGE
ncbi:MAG TPA: cysteine protease StiP family protein [Longimicrobium sp.]|nr:cysteine protease StiP family protein [Longimicrobium sp.]